MADLETELMLRVKAGDRAAFEEIFRLYQKPLAELPLTGSSGNRARAEDLLQDAFLRLWKAAAELRAVRQGLHVDLPDRPQPLPERGGPAAREGRWRRWKPRPGRIPRPT